MERQADFSGILGETFSLASDAIRPIAIYVLVVGGLGALGVAMALTDPSAGIASIGGGVTWEPGKPIQSTIFELVAVVVSVVAAYFLLAELLAARGRLPDRSTRIWAYVGMVFLSTLGVIIGFVLLIIPGIILLVRWSAASGFLIGGREGVVDALSASWDATSGKSWSIFGAAFVLFVVLIFAGGTLAGISVATSNLVVIGALAAFMEAIGNAIFLAFGIAVYALVSGKSDGLSDVFE